MSGSEILISKTKIIVPRRRVELLTRQRLLDALYEILDRKLIMVSAPAGYGKTSLLIDLAHHSDLPFCWLAIDSLDREPQRFIAYFIAAIAEHFPKFGNRSRSALNTLTNLEDGMEAVLVTLINEIYDEIHEHFVLVLDDFHLVDDVDPVVYFVNRFTQLADENCHLVLSSRSLTNLSDLTMLVAREQVGGLSFSDLSFRPEEIQALLSQNQQIHLSDEEARRLAEATEGWVTGLQFTDLSLIQGKAAAQASVWSPAAVGVDVFDYLAQQVLERQPDWLQLFLLRSSLLEEFDPELCEIVLAPFYSDRQDWSKIIDLIVQKNLFALPVGTNGQWLRYHHLFRDFLQARFRNERSEEASSILQRLAEFHEAHGDWEKAYQLHKQLGDFEALVQLIEHAGIFMYQHAMLTLDSWLKDLPPSIFQERPALLSLRGLIETQKGYGSEGIVLFDRAVEKFRGDGNIYGLALTLARRGSTYRLLGDYKDATRDADEALALAEKEDEMQWVCADALRVKGLSLFRQGYTFQAARYLERALDTYVRLNDTPVIPALLMETGVMYAETGEFAKAQSLYQKALEIWRRAGNLTWQADVLNNLGVLYYLQGDYERAAQTLEEGLLCARQGGYKRGEALILIGLGDLYAEVEDFEIAAQNYQQAEGLAQQLGARFLINYLALARFNLALLERDHVGASLASVQCAGLIRAEDSNYEYGLYQLMRGRLSLVDAKLEQAVEELAEAKQSFSRDGRQAEIILSHVWMAAAQSAAGDRPAAWQEMKSILQEPNRINHRAVLATHQARDRLAALRNEPQAKPTLRDLFKRADSLDVQLPRIRRQLHRLARAIEVPSPKLIIRAFGLGEVQVNGKPVTMKDWQTQSVRELFFYLLSLKRPATRGQIGDALWAGVTEPAKLNLRFKNEIYRLRRAMGQDVILFKENRYQFNPTLDHEYDVEAFEAFVAKGKSCSDPVECIDLYQRAIDLVHGRYLEDMDATWVLPERERLNQAYLWTSLALAELYLKAGRTRDALKVCEDALKYDATSEAAYRLKMQIYRRLGDRGSVIHTYKTCEQVMRNIYDLPPSEETQRLFEELTA
ncbi:MAG TPA: tetratricopeptide repeat protein [Anaerolineales bacterium]|nr:tetratricopeptide repeat protein [Anaerolineales bacterium]